MAVSPLSPLLKRNNDGKRLVASWSCRAKPKTGGGCMGGGGRLRGFLSASSRVSRVGGTAFGRKRSLHRSTRVFSGIYSVLLAVFGNARRPEASIMSISCAPRSADGCPVHTWCCSRFAQPFGYAQPNHLMLMIRAPAPSIMSISCAPCCPRLGHMLLMMHV